MNKIVKRKWLKALRSGEYKQGSGQLVTKPNYPNNEDYLFCCLGVLQNLYCLKHNEEFGPIEFGLGSFNNKVAYWSGLFSSGEDTESLMHMNDGTGEYKKRQGFKQIANWIEKHL